LRVQNATSLQANVGGGRIDNSGIFRKSLNAATATIPSGIGFNNSGAVEVEAGTLLFNGGVTNGGVVSVSSGATNRWAGGGAGSGTFNALASAMVEWTGGTFTLNPGAQLNGNGLYRLNDGNVTADPSLTVENLDIVSGTLGGTGTVTVVGQMLWTGGTMSGSGRTIIAPGATLEAPIPSVAFLSGRTLENGGTILFSGSGNLGLTGTAVITNRPGGVFNFENESPFGLGGSANGRFDNAGTIRKSAGIGTSTVVNGLTFNNSGAVEIQTGTLVLNGGFTNHGTITLSAGTTNRLAGGGSASGTFTAAASALVEWTASTFTLNPGAQLNGAGRYRLNGGTLTANPDLTVENLDLIHPNSTLGGTGVVTIAGAMNWTSGTMSGSGRTIIPVGATLNAAIPSVAILTSRTLDNGGTVIWTGAGTFSVTVGAVLTNRPGALFQAQNAAILGGGVARFDNAGTFRKSISSGTTTFANGMNFNNSGTVDIRSGILAANGGYVSSSNALLNCALGGTTAGTNYGQLQVAGTITLNGALSVNLANGFWPALNDSFTVLTAGARNGAFNAFYYPSNQVAMLLSNTPNSAVVRMTALGTPPLVFLPPVLAGSNILLTWKAASNATYRVEFNPDLKASKWNAVPGDVISLGNLATKLEPLTLSNCVYRVRLLP
jgi:hypothetical protein